MTDCAVMLASLRARTAEIGPALGLLALIGIVFAKKAKKGRGPQKVAASVKETAGVLQKAKPHPRPALPEHRGPEAIEAVARSSS